MITLFIIVQGSKDRRGKFGGSKAKGEIGSFRETISSFPIGSVESLKSAAWRKRLDTTSGQRRDNRLSRWFPCILRAVYRWKTNREPKRKGSCTQLPRCDIDFFPFNAHNGLSLSGLKKFQPARCLIPVLVSYFALFFFFLKKKHGIIIRGNCNSKIHRIIRRDNSKDQSLLRESHCLKISKETGREERKKYWKSNCLLFFSLFNSFFEYFLFSRLSFYHRRTKREGEKIFLRTRIRDRSTRLTLKCRLLKSTVDF